MHHAYIGASAGVHRFEGSNLVSLGLDDHRVWAIHAWRNDDGSDTVLAGTYGEGIFRSTDSGQTWQPANDGLTANAFRTFRPDPAGNGAILCGTEPARAFRSDDGGRSWREMESITSIPSCPDWYLPYSPRAGALRNIYSPPGQPERLLGAVEVGGLLNSDDGGKTWELLDTQPDDDIHYVTGDPTNSQVLYTARGWASLTKDRRREDEPQLGGLSRSDDGGKSWRKFYSDYTRAVIVPPTRPDLVLAGPAEQVGRRGRIEVSDNGGESWHRADDGIETPMPDMVELFVPVPGGSICAVCSGGRLLTAEPGEWQWRALIPSDAGVSAESISFIATSA